MKITFVDAGVLIAAARGTDSVHEEAISILEDPNREFASSALVRLEVLPKAVHNRRTTEVEFYETFFNGVSRWAEVSSSLLERAHQEAVQFGLAAMDALHDDGNTLSGDGCDPMCKAAVPKRLSR